MSASFNRMVKSLEAADFIILMSEVGDYVVASYRGMNDREDAFTIGAPGWDDIDLPESGQYSRESLQPGNMRGFYVYGVTIIPVKAGRA